MKKLLLFFALILAMSQSATAQFDSEEFKKGMEEMEKQMQQLFGQLGDTKIEMDTMFFKGFGQMEDLSGEMFELLPQMMESIDMEGMMKMMEENMKELEKMDFSQFEELFKDFNIEGLENFRVDPLVPAPKDLDKNGKPKKKSSKKSYKI